MCRKQVGRGGGGNHWGGFTCRCVGNRWEGGGVIIGGDLPVDV